MPLRRGFRVVAVAALVALAGALGAVSTIGFGLEEQYGLEWLFRLRGAQPVPPEPVIVRFDRDALERLRGLPSDPARWPQPLADCAQRFGPVRGLAQASRLDRLPRGAMTCLVADLTRRGAAVIVFDISFRRDPDREDGIAPLAATIRDHGSVILLDHAVRQLAPQGAGQGPGAPPAQADWLEGPHPELADAALATAPFLLPRGTDQVHQFWSVNAALPVPTQMPLRALEAFALPALAELARSTGELAGLDGPASERLARLTGWFRAQVAADGGLSGAELARVTPPQAFALAALARVYRGPNGYYLNFYGPPATLPTVSAADLLLGDAEGAGPVPDLAGRVVFVGYQETAIPLAGDSFPTAFRSEAGIDLSGVEILATAFANLLHDATIRALPEWARVALVAALGFAFTVASCAGVVWRGLALTLALAAAYCVLAVGLFFAGNVWLPLVVPLLGLLPLAIALGQLVHYLGAARWLGIYTPHQVSRQLLMGHSLGSAPVLREVTVMLTDIAGFTSMAERLSPAAVTSFVNEHFTMLNRCVEGEGGTLAQFIGDSVMSFWGAPDLQPDHAARACRAALAIAAALETENRRRAAAGQEPVRMRIGVHSGMVTAGNVGAPGRSNYGIVGDTVNATQRIEQLAKTVCPDQPTAAILVSARTRDLAGAGFAFRAVGAHALRGRRERIEIYRLDPAASTVASPAADRGLPEWPAASEIRPA